MPICTPKIKNWFSPPTFTVWSTPLAFPLIANPIPNGFSDIDIIPSIHSIKWPSEEVFSNLTVSISKYLISSLTIKINNGNIKQPKINSDFRTLYFLFINNANKIIKKNETIDALENDKIKAIITSNNRKYLTFFFLSKKSNNKTEVINNKEADNSNGFEKNAAYLGNEPCDSNDQLNP